MTDRIRRGFVNEARKIRTNKERIDLFYSALVYWVEKRREQLEEYFDRTKREM